MGDLQAMYGGLSQRVPMSQLGLAGPAPNAQSPRGGMPGGLDPAEPIFKGLMRQLESASGALEQEGRPKSVRMALELKEMSTKVNRMMLDHQQEIAQLNPQGQAGGAPTQFPNINAGGIL